jgi:hypothetical protein
VAQAYIVSVNRLIIRLFFNVTAGQAIAPLLAASDQCAQQDMADKIIDAAKVSACKRQSVRLQSC